MFEYLKKRWGINSGVQVLLIVIVFAITGFSVLEVKKILFTLIGVGPQTPLFIKIPVYILVIVPTYQIILLLVGSVFGQFRFFWKFEKKMIRRFSFRKKKREEVRWLEN